MGATKDGRGRRIPMKQRRVERGCRRRPGGAGVIGRRVRTLKRLVVPNIGGDRRSPRPCSSLDGLFKETADYIAALELKVRVMQAVVQSLSASDGHRQQELQGFISNHRQ